MSDFLYIDSTNKVNIERLSQANLSKGLYNNYQIGNSCWFNGSNNYFTRTFVAGDRRRYTWSGWVKRTTLGGTYRFFCTRTANNDNDCAELIFSTSDAPNVIGWGTSWRATSATLRDVSAWYHIVVSTDTTRATPDQRIRVYINGQESTFSSSTNPSIDALLGFNQASLHYLGTADYGAYTPFYLSEINYIDGQALDPSSFGYFDNQRDFVWKPKKYIGSYGTNGFYLNFNDSSNLGLDSSGNGNHWTVFNMSSSNQTTDSPSNNYCTLNPLSQTNVTLTNANLTVTTAVSGTTFALGTFSIPKKGKWYWEYTLGTNAIYVMHGISNRNITLYQAYYGLTGDRYFDGTFTSYGSANNVGDIMGVAVDADTNQITFYQNNISRGVISYSNLATDDFFPYFSDGSGNAGTATTTNVNFGQRSFTYTPPAGFKSLCTANLPVPSIKKANQFFDVRTYIGNGTQQAIRGISFSPNFVWIKSRSQSASNGLHDILRITSGGDESILYSDQTSAESIPGSYLSSFDSDGFTVNNNTSGNNLNSTYVSWQWGGANTQRSWNFNGNLERSATISIANPAVVNMTAHRFDRGQAVRFSTTGSLPSPISPGITYYAGNIGVDTFNLYDTEANAILGGTTGRIDTSSGSQSGSHTCRYASLVFSNQDSGFSIVGYIGNTTLSARNVGHGLNKTPQFIIVKAREAVTSWPVYHVSRGATKWILLNSTSAESTTNQEWNNTEPNSITFSIGNSSANSNQNSKYIAYCWTEVEGYSKIGSFTGNGLADGAFVYTGFRPRFILLKNAQNAYHWNIFDTSRNTFNVASTNIHPSDPAGDQATASLDILSNGFKLRTASYINDSSNAIIYIAFAEIPFKYALAR